MSDIRDTIRLASSNDVLKDTEWTQALPEVRWVAATFGTAPPKLQQRWRILVDGKPPRHEWRDVPTAKEGS